MAWPYRSMFLFLYAPAHLPRNLTLTQIMIDLVVSHVTHQIMTGNIC